MGRRYQGEQSGEETRGRTLKVDGPWTEVEPRGRGGDSPSGDVQEEASDFFAKTIWQGIVYERWVAQYESNIGRNGIIST